MFNQFLTTLNKYIKLPGKKKIIFLKQKKNQAHLNVIEA